MKKILIFALTLSFATACVGDLDVVPIDDDVTTTATLYDDPTVYKQLLAKLYGGYSLTGQQGPAGQGDIAGIDEGFSSYLRTLWYCQELTTDEAVIGWNDQTIKDFHHMDWGAGDLFIQGMYSRIFYQITFANAFLRETTDAKLDERGNVDSDLKAEIQGFRNEARFLRAMSYWHALDLFGNTPFVTEDDPIGAFLPPQATRAELFDYVESELLAIEGDMVDPMTNEYARADRAALWMTLAKLYLNAEVYIGEAHYDEVITYTKNVIDAGYTLHPSYQELFLADNDQASGIIFPIAHDGERIQSYGGTTFITHAAVGGSMNVSDFGIDFGWGGTRTTRALVEKFPGQENSADGRAMFYTDGQDIDIEDISLFTNGFAITKWKNKTSTGTDGQNATFVDIDFPMYRLADAYLMYAEAILRGGSGGNLNEALGYVNALRARAYGDNSGDIGIAELDLDFVLDERARELYWESHRRTDLIRYGLFTSGNYLWPWKGEVAEGVAVDDKYNIFPIPFADLTANPNLTQNTGY